MKLRSALLVTLVLLACGQGKRNTPRPIEMGGSAGDSSTPQPEGGDGATPSAGGRAASGDAGDAGEHAQAGTSGQPPLLEPPKPFVGPTWSSPRHIGFSSEPDGFVCASSIVGDLDGDGFDELLLLDSGSQLAASYQAGVYGAAYLFYGRSDFPSQLSALDADLIVRGAGVVGRLGDIDGDGYDDAGIKSYCECDWFGTNDYCACAQVSGVHLLFGGAQRYSGEARADQAGLHLAASGELRLAGIGDVDRDGFSDFLMGRSPFPGSASFRSQPPNLAVPTLFVHEHTWSAGDVDGDGFDDLVMSTEENSLISYGASDRFTAGFDSADATFETEAVPYSNRWPAALGDLDGDGFAELALPGIFDVRILYGDSSRYAGLYPSNLRDFSLITQVGQLVSVAAGDLNGDGARDLLFGANTGQTGRLVLVGGAGQRLSGDLLLGKTFAIANDAALFVSDCLSGTGDVNGDGFDDVAVGIQGGGVWLLLGGPFDE